MRDYVFRGERVFLRADLNVPQSNSLEVTDDSRIRAVLPTIRHLQGGGSPIILASHLGRPKGKVVDSLRLTPVGKRLSKLLGQQIQKTDDCIGPKVEEASHKLKAGEVLLLENLRFYSQEEKNDPEFSQALARLADLYVNDAFGTCHRAHASVVGITQYLQPAMAGLLLAKEIEYFTEVLERPKRPFVALLGGAKVSDKIGVIENLLEKVDKLIIGGAMAYPFLKAQGEDVGSTPLAEADIEEARKLLAKAEARKVPLHLPIDHVLSNQEVVGRGGIKEGLKAFDIGPQTASSFINALKGSKTVIWNGPLGLFEQHPFERGTREVAQFLSTLQATTVIGGGDTAAAIALFGLTDNMSHISTGGGAALEMLEGKKMPGIEALTKKGSYLS